MIIDYNDYKETKPKEIKATTELYRDLYNHLFTYGLRTFAQTVLKVIIDLYGDGQLDSSLTFAIFTAHKALSIKVKEQEDPDKNPEAEGPILVFNKKT